MVQTVKERMKRSPYVVENILNTIDAISLEVASLLQKSDENGSNVLENGGRSATLTPSPFVTEADHHNLQVSYLPLLYHFNFQSKVSFFSPPTFSKLVLRFLHSCQKKDIQNHHFTSF